MINSGITRRIDELGRIVIPKEMRYNLGIRDGEPLEVYIEDNKIVIKKYSQIENIKDVSNNIINVISDICNIAIMVSDRDKILITSKELKNCENDSLINSHKKLIDDRLSYVSNTKEEMYNVEGYFIILPIITSTDSSGLVFIITSNKNEEYIKYAKIIAKLIVQKIDPTS